MNFSISKPNYIGDKLLDIESGSEYGSQPTQHFTVIFNSFVLMTLFNEFNARKIHGQRNVFEGVFTNPIFYSIWIGTCIAQVCIHTHTHTQTPSLILARSNAL